MRPLKRAHEKYRLERGIQANQNVSAMLAGGQIVIEKCRMNKSGTAGSFNFTMANQFEGTHDKAAVEEAVKAEKAKMRAAMKAAGMADKDIEAILSGEEKKAEAPASASK